MSYPAAPKAVCECGSAELQPARDELAADPTAEHTDLAECLCCGRFVRLDDF
jgi:hypothetical protein